jgi:two-component system sensor histidine kinase QseC
VVDHSNHASIDADPELFEQCLVNIFKNSFEAIKRAARTGKIVIEISLHDNQTVAISVRDNGDGFDEADISLLTDPGYTKKAKSSTKSNRGLGLFVCSKIVELHEGKLAFANLNTGGAEVIVQFTRHISKRRHKRKRITVGA